MSEYKLVWILKGHGDSCRNITVWSDVFGKHECWWFDEHARFERADVPLCPEELSAIALACFIENDDNVLGRALLLTVESTRGAGPLRMTCKKWVVDESRLVGVRKEDVLEWDNCEKKSM